MAAPTQTPAELGYRMPAEWEPQAATWLSWPRREGISFPDSFDRVLPALREMVAALIGNGQSGSDPVCINVINGAHEAEARAVLDALPQQECITCHSYHAPIAAQTVAESTKSLKQMLLGAK